MSEMADAYPRGLIVKTSWGALGMVVDVNEDGPIVQVFAEGQQWVPMTLEKKSDHE